MDYNIYCLPTDFYLANPIQRFITEQGSECRIIIFDAISASVTSDVKINNDSCKFVFITNPEVVSLPVFINIVEETLNAGFSIFFLENEKVENYPFKKGIVRKINVAGGLDTSDLNALIGVPGNDHIGETIDFIALALEARALEIKFERAERAYDPIALVSNQSITSPTVQRAIKYLMGEVVPQDFERASSLFDKALQEKPDDSMANYFVGFCKLRNLHEFSEITQINEVCSFFEKAMSLGCEEANWVIAELYGRIPEKRNQAKSLFKDLADSGNPKALYHLGMIAEIEKNYAEALDYYSELAEMGNAIAQNAIGCMYAEGSGTIENPNKAAEWLELAVENGLPEAKSNLGWIFLNDSDEENRNIGIQYINEAAEEGVISAINLSKQVVEFQQKMQKESSEGNSIDFSTGFEDFMRGLDLPSIKAHAKETFMNLLKNNQ